MENSKVIEMFELNLRNLKVDLDSHAQIQQIIIAIKQAVEKAEKLEKDEKAEKSKKTKHSEKSEKKK